MLAEFARLNEYGAATSASLENLDLASLERAVARLRRSVGLVDSDFGRDVELREELRQSAIKGFEYTFGITVRLLERFLRLTAPDALDAHPTYHMLLRCAFDRGLAHGDFATWLRFRECRNRTNRIYDEAEAEAVYAIVPAFLKSVEELRAAMAARVRAERT